MIFSFVRHSGSEESAEKKGETLAWLAACVQSDTSFTVKSCVRGIKFIYLEFSVYEIPSR